MITVVGGGLGGLMLARVLHLHGVDVVVFEGDASPTSRHQGGMLDMHEESGQAALRAAGLFDEFRAHVLADGDALRVLDKNGEVHLERGSDGGRPEIERRALRALLLASLPAGMIRWDHRVSSARALDAGYEIAFANGTTHHAHVLVGADGGWSKVRPLLSSVTPSYLGLSFVEARIVEASTRHPRLSALVGSGSLFALSDEKGILVHREPNDELCVYAAFKAQAGWCARAVELDDVLAWFEGWHAGLRDLLARHDGPLVARSIDALPTGHRWDRVPGVTLIGDAAHLMSPFAGEGANMALQDGAALGLALVAHTGDVEAALVEYETAMFIRSARAAAESEQGMGICFGPDAPGPLVAFFNSHGG